MNKSSKLTRFFLLLGLSSQLAISTYAVDYQISGTNVNYPTQAQIAKFYNDFDIDDAFAISDINNYSQSPTMSDPYSAGLLNVSSQTHALNTLNYTRYISGIDYHVTIHDDYVTLAQDASYILALLGTGLSHTPERPSQLSNSSYDSLYNSGYTGASQSNLAAYYHSGGWTRNLSNFIVHQWLADDDTSNIGAVGHRRWALNPVMEKTGFGVVQNNAYFTASAMYSFDSYTNSTNVTGVSWPAQNMPVGLFDDTYPWSFSVGSTVSSSDTTVTLTRLNDNKIWTFDSSDSDKSGEYFTVENSNYGQKGCIIFRPDPNDITYNDGDVFNVNITGGTEANYFVSFFDVNQVTDTADTLTPSATPITFVYGDTDSNIITSDFTISQGIITKYTGSDTVLVIPSTIDGQTVTGIATSVFAENTNLTNVTLPSTLTSLESSAFASCTSLETVDFSSSSVDISSSVFQYCTSLTTLLQTSNIISVDEYAFQSTPWYYGLADEFSLLGDGVLVKYNGSGGAVVLPSTVKYVAPSAFSNSTNKADLTSITLPATLNTVGNRAFYFNENLSTSTIYNKTTLISPLSLGYYEGELQEQFVIFGYLDSTAESYATANNITFIPLDSTTPDVDSDDATPDVDTDDATPDVDSDDATPDVDSDDATTDVESDNASDVPITSITLNSSSLSILVGDMITLTPTVAPSNASSDYLWWSSSNTSAFTVENGIITAVGTGSGFVQVADATGEITASCFVTVGEADDDFVPVTSFSLDKTSLSLTVGDSKTLLAYFTPSNASNTTLSWSSSDTSIATVNFTSGRVVAQGVGTATITATSHNGISVSCRVSVSKASSSVTTPYVSNKTLPVTSKTTQNPIIVELEQPASDTTVNVTVVSATDAVLIGVTAQYEDGTPLTVNKNVLNNTYSFSQVGKAVTVTATFQGAIITPDNTTPDTGTPIPPSDPVPPTSNPTWMNPYSDVYTSDWYYSSVEKLTGMGLMAGTSDGSFEPYVFADRGTVVTVLHNMEGNPTNSSWSNPFYDVITGDPYFSAVVWAKNNNVVMGVSNIFFAPEDNVTREQFAVMLYSYANYKSYTSLSYGSYTYSFTDSYSVSSWANTAVEWCASHGLITGRDTGAFDPKAYITRGELATIYSQYCERYL